MQKTQPSVSQISAHIETRMSFHAFYLRGKCVAKTVAFILFIFPIISFCDDSIVQQISSKGCELKDSLIMNCNASQEETIKLLTEIKSWKDSMDQDLSLLKKENENQREEILQMNILLQNFLRQQSNETITTDKTILSDKFNEISIKRSLRSVKARNSVRQTSSGRNTKTKRQVKSSVNNLSSSSWAKIEISDHVIGYMDYDTYSVKIYNHASNKDVNMKNEEKKYYFEPIGQLEHLSAKSSLNNVSTAKAAEMIFKVNMWTDKVRADVHKFISDDLKLGPVNINLVRVLPLDEVMMFSGSGSSPHFEMDHNNWINYKSDKFLKFKFVCDKMKHCDHLAVQMKTNPEQFKLKMRFSLSSQNSQTKETKINIDTIMYGDMMNQIDQKLQGKEVVLLSADGKNQLLKESSENIIIQTVDDSQIPTKDSRNEVYRRLENMLQFSRTIIQKGDEKAWENVFWNQDNFRPDMSARVANDVYNKLDGVNQTKFVSEFSGTTKFGIEGGGSLLWGKLGSVNGGANLDLSMGGIGKKESLETALKESKDKVEWDGIKLVPKQMELYSMNMARLKNTQTFKDVNVKISYTTSMLTIDVRHDSSFEPETSSELSKLKAQVADFKCAFDLLRGKVNELDASVTSNAKQLKELKPVSDSTVSQVRQLMGYQGKDWKEGKNGGFVWQDNCDFWNENVKDIAVVDSAKEDCGIKCQENSGCTHFNFNKTTRKCALKKAPVSENFNRHDSYICGRLKVSDYHSISPIIWRITNYTSKKADTSVTSIYSDPFYTSQFGYKLKMKAYINGNGDGKGSHLSIFMEIQPGEYDALLPWPFPHTVTITLIDQSTNTTQKNNIEHQNDNSKYPECFQRPLNNKANGSVGSSKFASHDLLLEDGKYIKDDTLFIKITTSD